MKSKIAVLVLLLAGFALTQEAKLSRVAGYFVASQYAYGAVGGPRAMTITSGSSASGSYAITIYDATLVLVDGRQIMPFSVTAPITVGIGGVQETVTPSAVSSSCVVGGAKNSCTVTATFSFAHGSGTIVSSGTAGLQESINNTQGFGGGVVVIDQAWSVYGGTNAILTAAVPFQRVSIQDNRTNSPLLWTPRQNVSTILAAPTTLTATTVGFGLNGANTTSGTYTGTSTYNVNCAYVDPMGNEGPASATFSGLTAGTGATNQIGIAAPAASTGAVGYVCYISLASGTYNLSYQVPVTSAVCTMTTIETVTPACAVANTTYGQSASNMVVSALTVNTAPLHLLATTASTTAAYIGTPSGRTVYKYAPGGFSTASLMGFTTAQQLYTVATAAATTVPEVVATIPVPPGALNFPGAQIRICGNANQASAGSTATIQNFEFLWDAAGSNTAGAPVIIGQLQETQTLVTGNADLWSFCDTFQVTVSGAGVTAGSIIPVAGQMVSTYGAGVLGTSGVDVKMGAAIGSLNLAGTGGNTQRLHVVWLHTTGTDGAGTQVTGVTVEIL